MPPHAGSHNLPPTWLADCGNSAIKLAWWQDGQLSQHARIELAAGDSAEPSIDVWLPALRAAMASGSPAGGKISLCVTASRPELVNQLRQYWAGADQQLLVLGEQLALPALGQYATMGIDRLLAGLAAWQHSSGACVVVDCGTATTLSAWGAPGSVPSQQAAARSNAHGESGQGSPQRRESLGPVFMGGLILPGAAACASGMRLAAPHLPPIVLAQGVAVDDPLQHSTSGALNVGLHIGYRGLVQACIQQVAAAAAVETVISTGGLGTQWAPEAISCPHLVLEGLGLARALALTAGSER